MSGPGPAPAGPPSGVQAQRKLEGEVTQSWRCTGVTTDHTEPASQERGRSQQCFHTWTNHAPLG